MLHVVNVMLWRPWIPLYSSEECFYFCFSRFLNWLTQTANSVSQVDEISIQSFYPQLIFLESALYMHSSTVCQDLGRIHSQSLMLLYVPGFSSHFPTAVSALSLNFCFFRNQNTAVYFRILTILPGTDWGRENGKSCPCRSVPQMLIPFQNLLALGNSPVILLVLCTMSKQLLFTGGSTSRSLLSHDQNWIPMLALLKALRLTKWLQAMFKQVGLFKKDLPLNPVMEQEALGLVTKLARVCSDS